MYTGNNKKYFIAGKEIHSDRKKEEVTLHTYTELGFECVYSHLLAKRFINDGTLDKDKDVVVTCSGREFLYDNYIKTITWEEFEKISRKKEITNTINASDFFVDGILFESDFFHNFYMKDSKKKNQFVNPNLTYHQNVMNYVKNGIPEYKFFKEDFEIITNLNFNKDLKIPNKKYICLNRRFRKHRENLNMPVDYTKKLIKELIKEFNCEIYMTGFHNEEFLEIENVKWFNLRDWCTLINHENCLAVVQNQTGTANLTQLCGKTKLLNIILDMEMAHFMPIYMNGRRPDVLGKAVNFKNIRNLVFQQMGNIPDIIKAIKKYTIDENI